MSNELAGKIAVVTGASQGIGLACAQAMLEVGARVVPVARNLEKLKDVYKAYGNAVMPVDADLLQKADRQKLVERILDQTGQIDIFVANAGAYIGGNLVNNDPEEIEDVLTLNILGVISPVRHVVPHMIERKTGDIVVMGSIAGDGYLPYHEVVYGPSKAAPERFAKLLRTQVCAYGVRVASLSPGPTDTPLVASWDPQRLEKARGEQAFVSPDEVADAFMYMVTRPSHVAIPNMVVTPKAFNML